MTDRRELLTNAQSAEADRMAVAQGVPFLTLMENAGRAVAEAAAALMPPGGAVQVVCGPGNNGGDGYVAARILRGWGYRVEIASLVPVARLSGDAAEMARRWSGPIEESWPDTLVWGGDVIIDAIFGAGLSRAPEGDFAAAIALINQRRMISRIVAVDVPSGVHGDTGWPLGAEAVAADVTVTFFRRKPAHLLLPGRTLSGQVIVADIGIPENVLRRDGDPPDDAAHRIEAPTVVNGPGRLASLVRLDPSGHKYVRGHAIVVSGPPFATGAARLGARGALRAGAGLVTVASPQAAAPVNAAHLTAIMLQPFAVPDGLTDVLADTRRNAILIGPGASVGAETRAMVEIALGSKAAVVLDADALTSFAGVSQAERSEDDPGMSFGFLPSARPDDKPGPDALFALTRRHGRAVLTPHAGEFDRVFGRTDAQLSKLERVRAAAVRAGAVVVLKGADTVIAEPGGRAAINDNAPPWLATAGSGDVLAGFVTGFMAQGLSPFDAACSAVWLHGEVATRLGPGLIAEDLPEAVPGVYRALLEI